MIIRKGPCVDGTRQVYAVFTQDAPESPLISSDYETAKQAHKYTPGSVLMRLTVAVIGQAYFINGKEVRR